MKYSTLTAVIIASLAFIVGLAFLANGVRNFRKPSSSISVTGMAEKNFTSDLIVWDARYKVFHSNLKDAFAELKVKQEQLKDYLKEKQIPADAVTYSSISMDRRYNYSRNAQGESVSTFSGYELSQEVTVSSEQVDLVEQVSRDVTELINDGVEIYSMSPRYYYTKLNELKISMLADAAADAEQRAQVLAQGGRSKLGTLSSSSMGVFQIVGLNSNEDYSWGGSFNTSSKEKTASVTVRASYTTK